MNMMLLTWVVKVANLLHKYFHRHNWVVIRRIKHDYGNGSTIIWCPDCNEIEQYDF